MASRLAPGPGWEAVVSGYDVLPPCAGGTVYEDTLNGERWTRVGCRLKGATPRSIVVLIRSSRTEYSHGRPELVRLV